MKCLSLAGIELNNGLCLLVNFSNDFDSFLSIRSYKYSEQIKDSTILKSTFSDFYSTLTHLYNKHIVVDKVFKSNRNKYNKPWITMGLAKACKVESKLHNIWIKSGGTMKENVAKTKILTINLTDLNLKTLSNWLN